MIAVVIGSESSLSLSVSTQSQGGHQQFDVGVGGSEIRPGQRFQVQDHPDRAGLVWAGHGRSTALRHCSGLQPGLGGALEKGGRERVSSSAFSGRADRS